MCVVCRSMSLSIEQYKKQQRVRAARARNSGKHSTVESEYNAYQLKYLEFCMQKDLNPDTRLLDALR